MDSQSTSKYPHQKMHRIKPQEPDSSNEDYSDDSGYDTKSSSDSKDAVDTHRLNKTAYEDASDKESNSESSDPSMLLPKLDYIRRN